MQTVKTEGRQKARFVDKEWLRRQIAEHNEQTGFVLVPGATGEMAQQSIAETLRAQGIDPDSIRCPQDDLD